MDNKRRLAGAALLAGIVSVASQLAEGRQNKVSYPTQILGVWQAGGQPCRLPGNLDSDTRMEITPEKLIDYEQWNKPTVVLQISKKPKAWKIKSRLHIDGDASDQYEVYILSGSDNGTLTVVDQNRSATYLRCT